MEERSDVRRLRAEIDEIDDALVRLLARRRDAAVEIAKIKQKTGSDDDEKRLAQVLDRVEETADRLGLDGKRVRELWQELVGYMIEEQMKKYPY